MIQKKYRLCEPLMKLITLHNLTLITLLFITLFYCLNSVQAEIADDQRIRIHKLVKKNESTNMDNWRYLVTQIGVPDSWVAQFDGASRPGKKWKILTFNGKKPSKKQINKFEDEQYLGANHHLESPQMPINHNEKWFNLRALISTDTILKIEETNNNYIYHFIPNFKIDKHIYSNKFRAQFHVHKDDDYIHKVIITLDERIKLFPFVFLEEMHVVIEYSTLSSGDIFLEKQFSNIKSKVFWKESIETYQQVFSNIVPVTP